jgi:hypothetical protein
VEYPFACRGNSRRSSLEGGSAGSLLLFQINCLLIRSLVLKRTRIVESTMLLIRDDAKILWSTSLPLALQTKYV